MSILDTAIWGIIQGITEFIPISSSGHLVVIPRFFGIAAPDLIINIVLHIGTLLAVIIFFWKDIINVFTSQKRLFVSLLLATLPILVCALFFLDKIKVFYESPERVGWMLIINGFLLFAGHLRLRRTGSPVLKEHSRWRVFIIGIAQSFALLPGISRSGITITTGIYTGLDREHAYKYSFFLFTPAMLLAILYSVKEISSTEITFNANILVAAAFSMVFGLLALKFLFFLLKRTQLHLLGFYCIALGLLTIAVF